MSSTLPSPNKEASEGVSLLSRHAWLAPLILVVLNALLTLPEILTERIYPWDDALYAANGTFFLTLFQSLPAVIADPMSWMTEYYRQYPALFVRRQPPVFSIIESGIYGILGISAISAKLTVFLFSSIFVIGWFMAIKIWTNRTSIAFLTGLLTLSLPMTVQLSTAVRLDIPALAFFVWALYFFHGFEERKRISFPTICLVCILLAGSLYTYQLPMFGVIALFVYWATSNWPNNLKDNGIYVAAGIFTLLMIPLIVFTLKFAYDNVAGVVGKTVKDFEVFTPVDSKLDPKYWLYYLGIAWDIYRLPTLALFFWLATKWKFPIKNWEIFMLLWILAAYLGFSLFPSKGDRYAYYFMLPALSLAAGAFADFWSIADARRRFLRPVLTVTLVMAISWNIISIPGARPPLTTGFDAVAKGLTSDLGSGNILYHGRLESAFIYYVAKEDRQRKLRVLRSGNELTADQDIAEFMSKTPIDVIVMQEDTSKQGNGYAEVYQPVYRKLVDLLSAPDSPFRPWREFKIRYGVPGNENDVALQAYIRKDAGAVR